jgi:hypothetical protein
MKQHVRLAAQSQDIQSYVIQTVAIAEDERSRMIRREDRERDGEKEPHKARWEGTRLMPVSVASKRVFDVIHPNEDPRNVAEGMYGASCEGERRMAAGNSDAPRYPAQGCGWTGM